MKRMLVKVLLVLAVAGMVVGAMGCQTWKGAGKDVQNLGETMEGDQPAHNP